MVELSASQAQSAYFNTSDDYDKDVYENTGANWVKIFVMFFFFYIFQALHWWANFELGINEAATSTIYNLIIFATAIVVISIMLFMGSVVNRKKAEHEFWTEKILEEEQRIQEEKDRAEQKAANEAKLAAMGIQKA